MQRIKLYCLSCKTKAVSVVSRGSEGKEEMACQA